MVREVTPPKPRQKKRRKVEYVPSKEDEAKEKEFASLKSLVKKFNSKREKVGNFFDRWCFLTRTYFLSLLLP